MAFMFPSLKELDKVAISPEQRKEYENEIANTDLLQPFLRMSILINSISGR